MQPQDRKLDFRILPIDTSHFMTLGSNSALLCLNIYGIKNTPLDNNLKVVY